MNNGKIESFDKHYAEYDEWFVENQHIYKSELDALKKLIPCKQSGLEVGVGSGRFASLLGIQTGVEPSENMAEIAKRNGIEVLKGTAEKLPIKKSTFDFVLMVTVLCFLDDVVESLSEAHRVLREKGILIVSIIDKNSILGSLYEKEKDNDKFFKNAVFYSTDEVIQLLKKAGFKILKTNQTVFAPSLKSKEKVKEGYGEGCFVSIKAEKI